MSHSRGGLIGELLARGTRADDEEPITEDDLALFDTADRSDEREALQELSEALPAAGHAVRPRRLPGLRHDSRRWTAGPGISRSWSTSRR